MTPESNPRVRLFVWLAMVFGAVVVPAIIGILIGLTPNYPVRSADAGRFVSATTSVGGFFAPDVTTVQTTRGSISVDGHVSAERGQAMEIEDRLKDGLQLCVEGQSRICTKLASPWAGRMQQATHPYYPFAPLARAIGATDIATWIALGVLTTFVIGLVMFIEIDDERTEDRASE